MRLCVYAIMRDEGSNTYPWSETTADADERFVLDTGSTDDTFDDLVGFGVTVQRATFAPFRFDDARNAALALAPEADLYLRLDADERLPDGWRQVIEDAYRPDAKRYRYRVHNADGIWNVITRDDLHQRDGFRWKYPTHEVLVGPPVSVDLPGLVVQHRHGDRRTHHDTNLHVLELAVEEYPGDHRMLFYLGREYWYLGDWTRTREVMVEFLDLADGWGAERCEAYRILAAIDYHPERWLWKAIGEAPDRREPWVDLTRHFLGEGEHIMATVCMEMATLRTDETIYTTDSLAWGEPFEALADRVRSIGVP